ncbi:MAG: leucine-rich repeat protein [Clostridia bacterium]|nr:leucine-rich repeat protein [Clostridia bacterium]
MKKKILSLIVAIFVLLTMLPVMGLATDTPPAVDITEISYMGGAVSLAWAGQDGVDGYRVYRKTGTGKWTVILSSTTGTSYTDSTVTEGATYSYTVRSFVGKTYSTGYADTAKTIKAKATVDPAPVTITQVSYSNGAVSLAWQGQDGVDGYRVYRKTGTGKWTTVLSSTTATSYTDTTVTEGATYSYTVRSFVGKTYSTGYADTAKTIKAKTAVDPAPVTITAISYANGAVSLAWAGQDGVDGYRVYRKTGTGKWTTVLSSTTGTSYTDSTVTEGATYSYTVRSFVGKTYSTGYADTAKTIKAATAAPDCVNINMITQSSTGGIMIAWDGSADADGYRVYKKTGSGGWKAALLNTTDTTFTDTEVTPGATYYYTVRAVKDGVWSTGYNNTAKSFKAGTPGLTFDNGTVTGISDKSVVKLAIPESIDGVQVTGIGRDAFKDLRSLASVTIPDGVKSIGEYAFAYCGALSAVNIPGSVEAIGEGAFQNCTALTSATIPEGIKNITVNTFRDCESLTSVTIPAGVTSIGGRAFSGCSGLTSVTIPEGVESIGNYAFSGCESLTSVTIPEGVSSIGTGAFENCENLASVVIPDGVTDIGRAAFQGCKSLTSVTVPGSVEAIGSYAFENCSALSSVTISEGVVRIGNDAFKRCDALKSVVIPGSVETIENYAFAYCSGLTSATISEGVKDIGGWAFLGCASLASVNIPGSAARIGDCAFDDCTALTSATISEGVEKICQHAFENCSALSSVTIPESVKDIENGAFWGCGSLTSVDIPGSVKNIGERAFYNCESLKSVTINEGVESIGLEAFANCGALTTATIPQSVTYIGGQAFASCESLASVAIPEGVGGIEEGTFAYCSALTKVIIPASVTYIGNGAFVNCESLTDIYYAGTAEQWGSVSVGRSNIYLTGAEIHYNSAE